MISHHVTCHVTEVSCIFLSFKRKLKRKQNKINIKSEKIKEKKNCQCSKHSITIDKKANTSLTINNNIPNINLFLTSFV